MLSRMRAVLRPISSWNCARSAAERRARTSAIFFRISAFALARLAGMTKKPSAATTLASRSPVTSAAAVLAAIVINVPRPERAGAGRGGGGDRVSRAVGELARFAPAIVRLDDRLRRAADGLDHAPPLVVERTRVVVVLVLADDAIAERAASIGQVLRDPLPLAEVGVDQPVDQVVHALLDLLRRVGDDLPLEALLHARPVQQIHHPADPHRVVEVAVAAPLHLEQHVVDRRHPSLELARHVLLEEPELALDVVEEREIPLQGHDALARRDRVAIDQRGADAERIQQLQLRARGVIERGLDVALERLEPARRPELRLPGLRAERRLGADGKDLRGDAQQPARVVRHVRADLAELLLPRQDVDLVDDDDDLLAPVADLLEEHALGFGERPVRGRDEQDEVRARHELGRDLLVLADDRVGAGRVDDVDVVDPDRASRAPSSA